MTVVVDRAAATFRRSGPASLLTPTITRRTALWLLVLVPFLMRVPGVLLLPDLPYSGDEEELVRSALDRFLGVPPTTLVWPAIPIQLADTLMVAGQLLVAAVLNLASHTANPLRAAGLTLAHLYEDPTPLVTPTRLLVAAVASLGPLAFLKLVTRFDLSRVAVAAGVLTVAVSPIFWENSHMVKGDALALPPLVFALALVPARPRGLHPRTLLVSGALLGVASACRILTAPGVVCLCALALASYPRRRWPVVVGLIVAGFVVAALLACPFWWTDPVRSAKSVLGNLTKSGAPNWRTVPLLDLDELVGWSALVLMVPGVLWIIRVRSWPAAALIVSGFVVYLLPVALSRSFFPRYLIPTLPFAALLVSFGVEFFVPWVKRTRLAGAAGVVVIAAIVVSSSVVYARYFISSHTVSDTHQVGDLLRSIATPQEPIVLSSEFERYLAPSSATLTRVLDRASSRDAQVARVQALFRDRGISDVELQPFIDNFNEVDRAAAARTATRLLLDRSDGYNLWTSEAPGTPESVYQDLSPAEAVEGFQTGRFKVLVSTERPSELGSPTYSIGQYAIYVH